MQFHVGKSVLKSHLQLPFTDEIQLAMQVASPKAMLFADGLCFESAIHFSKIFMPTEQRHSLATKLYVEWWKKSSSNFCKDKLTCAKPNSSPVAPKEKNVITIRTVKSKLATEVTPPLSKFKEKQVTKAVTEESKKVVAVKPKTPLSIPTSKPKPITTKALESIGENKKRTVVVLSQESSSDKGQLMKELELLNLKEKKLKESIEGIDAERAQKQHVVSTLQVE
ncbi:hypothetical protein RHGRI_017076 [Rhododendron griersonianum]|uniref:Uncharacterized protein n=1 Tax=Rhododendron griersonianum TaxID=479676 RepID=A0AAV6JWJ3_9ERIC|nr:hypothetical protein RHGRI_017076 [Rhododendron griersonianum]